MTRSTEERFLAKVIKQDGCWLWAASLDKAGYGRFFLDGKARRAHKVSYDWWVGEVPEGLELDHTCRVRRCVNPNHLEPVTRRENIVRGVGPTAINARKTHCPQGHEYTLDNLVPSMLRWGSRTCLVCQRTRAKKQYWDSRPDGYVPRVERTACPQGHEYTAENTNFTKAGAKYCRACKREKALARYHANKDN